MGIVLIIVIMTIINKLSKKADIQDYGKYKEKIDMYKELIPFSEDQKEAAVAPFSGFWQFNKVTNDSSTPWTSDRIEIKKNGIIWRVRTAILTNQAGYSIPFMHASTAYIRPFAKFKTDSQRVIFDVRIIRQSFITKTDTCYGASNFDTTWEITRTGGNLNFSNFQFSTFDTTDLKHFFPEGAINVVDAVSVNACRQDFSLEKFAKDNDINLPLKPAGTTKKEAK